jgi:DNA-directed RNA polymerase specialized sigma24 family protein
MSDDWKHRIHRLIPVLGEYLGKIVASEYVNPLTQWTLFWAWRWRHECPKGDESAMQAWVITIARELTLTQCCARTSQVFAGGIKIMNLSSEERRFLRVRLAVDDLDPSALKDLLAAALDVWKPGSGTRNGDPSDWHDR